MNSNIHKLFGQKTNYYQIKTLDFVSCSYLLIIGLLTSFMMFSFISKKKSDKKFCTWDIICEKICVKMKRQIYYVNSIKIFSVDCQVEYNSWSNFFFKICHLRHS
jgi:hypothetical protein